MSNDLDVSITVNPMDGSEKSRKSGVASLTAIPGSGFLNKIELELEEQAAATNDISQLTQNNIDTKVGFSKSWHQTFAEKCHL